MYLQTLKSIRLFVCLCLVVLLTACKGKDFSITFEVDQKVNGNYKLMYYASDKRGGFHRESAVAITSGKGEIKGQTINPTLVYIYTGSKAYPFVIYVKRGEKIKVTGSDPLSAKWMVGGNDINKEWSAWRSENADVLSSAVPDKINAAVAKYVTANPENPLSALLLLTTYNRLEDETGFRRLWRDLKGEAADPQWSALAGRADQPGRYVPIPARVKSMAFRSMQNGVDTIRPDSVKGVLLFFWHNTFNQRKAYTDSLKALAKEFPDSATRTIADICLDADSVAWRSTIRTDSLKKIARFWAPAGLGDAKVEMLNVPRTPFFIILTPDGHQRFRGSDLDSALTFFRKTLKEK